MCFITLFFFSSFSPLFPSFFQALLQILPSFLIWAKKFPPKGGGGVEMEYISLFQNLLKEEMQSVFSVAVKTWVFFSDLVDFGIIVSEWSYNFGENNCLLTLNYKTKLWPILFWTIYRLFLSLDSFIKTSFTLVKYKIWIRIFSN